MALAVGVEPAAVLVTAVHSWGGGGGGAHDAHRRGFSGGANGHVNHGIVAEYMVILPSLAGGEAVLAVMEEGGFAARLERWLIFSGLRMAHVPVGDG